MFLTTILTSSYYIFSGAFNDNMLSMEYEELLSRGNESHILKLPDDEWDAISLNYTSGTTGNPKGVVSHHR